LILTGLFVVFATPFVRWIADDAWISFRYAANLAAGHGLVYNVGERVEGMSNMLWTLFLALPAALRIRVETAAVVASALCAAGTLWIAFRLFDTIAPAAPVSMQFTFGRLLAAAMPSAFYATSGMETSAVSLCLTGAAFLHARGHLLRRDADHAAAIFCVAIVAFLRPEGVLFLAADAIWSAVRYRRRMPRPIVRALVVAGGAFASYLAGKTHYYGSPIPNPYWARPPIQWHYIDPIGRATHAALGTALGRALPPHSVLAF